MNELLDDERLFEIDPDLRKLRNAHALLTEGKIEAESQLEDLANHGSVMSMLYLAAYYQGAPRKDQNRSAYWYKRAYEKKSLSGMIGFAIAVAKDGDIKKAEDILKIGAHYGDAVSMYRLAGFYLRYNKSKERRREATNLLEKSIAKGHTSAKVELGKLLLSGRQGLGMVPRGLLLLSDGLIEVFRVAYRDKNDRRLY